MFQPAASAPGHPGAPANEFVTDVESPGDVAVDKIRRDDDFFTPVGEPFRRIALGPLGGSGESIEGGGGGGGGSGEDYFSEGTGHGSRIVEKCEVGHERNL